MSNSGTGFLRFQAGIDQITEAIGEPKLRDAIADHFSACLKEEMRAARGLSFWSGLPWGVFWTMATTAEFEAAAQRAHVTLALPDGPLALPAVAQAPWMGSKLVLRGLRVQAEGGGYRLRAISAFEGSWQYDRKLRRDVKRWQISVDDDFLRAAKGSAYGGSRPKSTHAGTMEAAIRSARRMAKDFFGVHLVDL